VPQVTVHNGGDAKIRERLRQRVGWQRLVPFVVSKTEVEQCFQLTPDLLNDL
jgi:hypothetical protein